MESSPSIAVTRPKRWDEPMDPSMSDSDVAWLRSRQPFASLDSSKFPRSTPLEGVLKNDCRLRRYQAGELIVREGDYGNSAFLVLAGQTRLMIDSLRQEQMGRETPPQKTWAGALAEYLFPSRYPESRSIAAVRPTKNGKSTIHHDDDHTALFLQDVDAVLSENQSVRLGPGELFGEVAAMYRSPRTATVLAETESALLEIRWQGLKLLRNDPGFAEQMDQHYRSQWLPLHLREVPLLRHLPDDRMIKVVAATQLRSFGRLAWNTEYRKSRKLSPKQQIESEPLVIQQGGLPTDLIIVRAGFGRLCQPHGDGFRTTAYLGKGQVFALEELAYNATRPETAPPRPIQNQLRAVGFLDTLHIPAEVFATEILPFVRRSELPADVGRQMLRDDGTGASGAGDEALDRRRQPRRDNEPSSRLPVVTDHRAQRLDSTSMLEFVVQERLNNGRQAMVIDLDRCTRCDDCVKACAATHDGNPRFARTGLRHDQFQFVNACMHCTDPVCMIGCPTGAILRDEATGVIQIHEPICVGCKTCANACPYDAIEMVEIVDRAGRPYLDQQNEKPIGKAVKCDLCVSQPGGPACVSACPHDALVRIDLSETSELQTLMRERRE
ncbi:cyclic nucleotide-binding domain-containing protein [Crateriforma conspicua]|uniref:cyclic nucleotide-binding domain-containing protein n=1 Tax=Crateriforma conspicua TaxID=2527996 RepID=UPI0011A7FBAE|nr:cyclic nucleotide-binding domain-containing protein [Crateriforma conspicua]